MQDLNPEKRVQKMVNAIKQEAQDKAQSIKDIAHQQFNIDKNRIYNQEKEKIVEHYKKELENYCVKKRIERSAKISEQRLSKMKTRHDLITKLKDEVKAQVVSQFSNNQGKYKEFMKKLIVQAMVKLMEKEVELSCLKKDLKLIEEIKGDCEKTFAELIKNECKGAVLNCKLNINKFHFLDDGDAKVCGGISLACFDGKIQCHNTVDNRIDLCFQEFLPEIRGGLFKTV